MSWWRCSLRCWNGTSWYSQSCIWPVSDGEYGETTNAWMKSWGWWWSPGSRYANDDQPLYWTSKLKILGMKFKMTKGWCEDTDLIKPLSSILFLMSTREKCEKVPPWGKPPWTVVANIYKNSELSPQKLPQTSKYTKAHKRKVTLVWWVTIKKGCISKSLYISKGPTHKRKVTLVWWVKIEKGFTLWKPKYHQSP